MEAKALLAIGPRDSTALACQHWVQARPVLHPLPLSSESLAEVSWISFPLWFPAWIHVCARGTGLLNWLGSCCSKQGMRPGHCSPPPWKTDSKAILAPTAATHTHTWTHTQPHTPHTRTNTTCTHVPHTHTTQTNTTCTHASRVLEGAFFGLGERPPCGPKGRGKGQRGNLVGAGGGGCIAHVLSSGHHFLLNLCGASQDRSRLAKFRKWSLSQRGKCGSSFYMHPAPTKMTPCLRSTPALHP